MHISLRRFGRLLLALSFIALPAPAAAATIGDPVRSFSAPAPGSSSWARLGSRARIAWSAPSVPASFGPIVRIELETARSALTASGCAASFAPLRTTSLTGTRLGLTSASYRLVLPLSCHRWVLRFFNAAGDRIESEPSGTVITGARIRNSTTTPSAPSVSWIDPAVGDPLRRDPAKRSVRFRLEKAPPLFEGDASAELASATISRYAGPRALEGACPPASSREYRRERRAYSLGRTLRAGSEIEYAAALPADDRCRFMRVFVRDVYGRATTADSATFYIASSGGPDGSTGALEPPVLTSAPPPGAPPGAVSFGWDPVAGAARYECALRIADGPSSFATCTSPRTYELAAGDYTFYVRAVDASGGHSAARSQAFSLAASPTPSPTPPPTAPPNPYEEYPSSLASMGDSITRAFNTGAIAFFDNPAGSWSTGSDPSVFSLHQRIVARRGTIPAYNYAITGARMADLPLQASLARSRGVAAVTIEMGGNDLCALTESGMTSVTDFERHFRSALGELAAAGSPPRIYVASIPNVRYLWQTFKGDATARTVWWTLSICQSYLANPTSSASADVERRARVEARQVAYNEILRTVCAQTSGCVWDQGNVYRTEFAAAEISPRDYFHPSLTGQRRLAEATWSGWNFAP